MTSKLVLKLELRGGDLRSPSPGGDRRSPPLLTDKEKKIHDDGLVTILKQIHDDLDAAVFEAYGWEDLHENKEKSASGLLISTEEMTGDDLPGEAKRPEARFSIGWEQELLTRLVALNHERAAEEALGKIRWLRPEYQAPEEAKEKEVDLPMEVEKKAAAIAVLPAKLKWPKGVAAQFSAVTHLLPTTGPDAETISACFGKKSKKRIAEVEEILETLESLGKLG